jgi:hypothetical protein
VWAGRRAAGRLRQRHLSARPRRVQEGARCAPAATTLAWSPCSSTGVPLALPDERTSAAISRARLWALLAAGARARRFGPGARAGAAHAAAGRDRRRPVCHPRELRARVGNNPCPCAGRALHQADPRPFREAVAAAGGRRLGDALGSRTSPAPARSSRRSTNSGGACAPTRARARSWRCSTSSTSSRAAIFRSARAS